MKMSFFLLSEEVDFEAFTLEMIKHILFGTIFLLNTGHLSNSFAAEPDYDREQRLADQIVDAVLDGDVEWLTADGREFLSFFFEAEDPAGAILLLHGRGFHPDWQDTIHPLRVGLVEHGWSTLSLQMPVLDKEAKYYDYVPIFPAALPRIEAGIKFLQDQNYNNIVVVAHSCSVHMAMAWFKTHGDENISAFVGLGMGATDYQQPMREPFPLEQFSVPVFDLYGELEFPAVIRKAPERLAAMMRAGNSLSVQKVLPDADHYFTNKGEELTDVVAEWLGTLNQ